MVVPMIQMVRRQTGSLMRRKLGEPSSSPPRFPSLFSVVSDGQPRLPPGVSSTPQRRHLSYKTVLFLSHVLPQPSASAAGVRTSYMLQRLSETHTVHFASPASSTNTTKPTEELGESLNNVTFHHLPLNDSSAVDYLLQSTIACPDIILYDRFFVEEAHSFRFHKACPEAVHVVDMQDMHSLRWGRQAIVEQADEGLSSQDDLLRQTAAVLRHAPSAQDEHLVREIASLHRSDLALVCSPTELQLLRDVYQLPPSKLCLAPFWIPSPQQEEKPTKSSSPVFDKTKDFVFVGGFRHAPNVDAVRMLVRHVWPQIRNELSLALAVKTSGGCRLSADVPMLHIYGAYPSREILQYHDPAKGVLVHGFEASLDTILGCKRVMLAPLRYGAGIKGKIVDSLVKGVPVVTTPVGSEGIWSGDPKNANHHSKGETWRGGIVSSSVADFCQAAVELYSNPCLWSSKQQSATSLLEECFSEEKWEIVSKALDETVRTREERRASDFTRAMLWHHTARSTEYFSRWIEAKEAKSQSASNVDDRVEK